jgi:hypothetical protein
MFVWNLNYPAIPEMPVSDEKYGRGALRATRLTSAST